MSKYNRPIIEISPGSIITLKKLEVGYYLIEDPLLLINYPFCENLFAIQSLRFTEYMRILASTKQNLIVREILDFDSYPGFYVQGSIFPFLNGWIDQLIGQITDWKTR